MPADFTPATTFIWHPTTQSKRRPKPKSKKKPKKKRAHFTAAQRAILIARLETATADGRIDADEIAPIYDRILAALFPEDFLPARCPPRSPAVSPPSSADRVTEYAQRESRREQLWHPADPDAVVDDRLGILARSLLNGRGVLATGWAGEDKDEADGAD